VGGEKKGGGRKGVDEEGTGLTLGCYERVKGGAATGHRWGWCGMTWGEEREG